MNSANFQKLMNSIEVFDEPELESCSFVGITNIVPHPECGNCHYYIDYFSDTGEWEITAEAHGECAKGSKFWERDVVSAEDEFTSDEIEMLKKHCLKLYDEMCHEK